MIAPKPGGSFTFAEAVYKSVYGEVQSKWRKTETGYRYEIEIPANCTARILLPDGTSKTVPAGTYTL